jgi:hypothetical protein
MQQIPGTGEFLDDIGDAGEVSIPPAVSIEASVLPSVLYRATRVV